MGFYFITNHTLPPPCPLPPTLLWMGLFTLTFRLIVCRPRGFVEGRGRGRFGEGEGGGEREKRRVQ